MSPVVPEGDGLIVDDPFTPGFDSQTKTRAKLIIPAIERVDRSETDITKDAIAWLKNQPNTYAYKLFSGAFGESGHPDIDGCINGRSIKIEMKRPGKEPTVVQMARLRQWRQAHAIVGWATSVQQVRDLVTYSVAHPDWRNPLTGPGVGIEAVPRS